MQTGTKKLLRKPQFKVEYISSHLHCRLCMQSRLLQSSICTLALLTGKYNFQIHGRLRLSYLLLPNLWPGLRQWSPVNPSPLLWLSCSQQGFCFQNSLQDQGGNSACEHDLLCRISPRLAGLIINGSSPMNLFPSDKHTSMKSIGSYLRNSGSSFTDTDWSSFLGAKM